MMPQFRERAASRGPDSSIASWLQAELEWAKTFLLGASPRELRAHDKRVPMLIFSDAALEGKHDEIATVGGVLLASAALNPWAANGRVAVIQGALSSLRGAMRVTCLATLIPVWGLGLLLVCPLLE